MATSFEDAREWKHYYFWGIATGRPATLQLTPAQLQALLDTVGSSAAVATVAALEPRHLINHKGTTVWILLYMYALMHDKQALLSVAQGQSSIAVDPDVVHRAFEAHVQWPPHLLEQYRTDFGTHWPFVMPFVSHREQPAPTQLTQSLRLPDGTMEVMGVTEFDDQRPETLLALIHAFAERHGQRYR